MRSMKIADDISSIMKTKKALLEKAEKILLSGDYDHNKISTCDSQARVLVDRVADLYDSLQEILSETVQVRSCSSLSPSKYLEFAYSHFHRLRWSSKKRESIECKIINDEITTKNFFALEADLYLAMWLSCLILLNKLNPHGQKKRHNRLASQIRNRAYGLQRSIRRCQFLVGLLDRIVSQAKTKGVDGDQTANSNICVGLGSEIWIDRIAEWKEDDRAEETDDADNSLNIFSVTKEQLELEEQQLLNMATTPIPMANAHNVQIRKGVINGNPIKTKKLLIGKLLQDVTDPSDSSSSIIVEFDNRGFVTTSNGSSEDKDKDFDNKPRCWSLTSQSVMLSNYNKSPNVIQIKNMISFATGDLTALTLEVGQDHMLWQSQISTVQSNTERKFKLMEEQEKIKELWPVKEVMNAQNVALELFIGEIRKGI